jgi:hypothetical protein
MFRSIKQRWQRYLDGKTVSMFEHLDEKDPLAESVSGRPDPYRQLSSGRMQVYRLPGALPVVLTPVKHQDDAGLPDWAREALAEMDKAVGVVITDERTEVRTPQYVRRTRRNILDALHDDSVEMLAAADEEAVPALVERMLARSRRASDPEVTGMIPVIDDSTAWDEAYA